MKHILTIFLCALTIITQAQTYRVSVKQETKELNLLDIAGAVEVHGISEDEIRISTLNSPKDTSTKKGAESNNTQLGIHFEQAGNKIVLKGTFTEGAQIQYRIYVPARLLLSVHAEDNFTKALLIQKFKGNIDIQTNGDVTIPDLTSGLVLQNGKGSTTISIDGKLSDPVSIITQSGNVALTLPRRMGVDLKLGTGTGNVLATLKKGTGTTSVNAKQFTTSLNGGGPKIQIRSVSGNILVLNSM